MYKIYYGENLIYSSNVPDMNILKANLKLEVNTAGGLSMDIPSTHFLYDKFEKLKMLFKVTKGTKTIFKGQLLKDPYDLLKIKSLDIEGKLSCLNDSIYEPFEFSGSPEDMFSKLVKNHNKMVDEQRQFKVGNITVKDKNDYITRSSEDYNTTAELLKRLIKSLGGYLSVRYEDDGDYLDWLEDFPTANLQKIEFSKNLIGLTTETSAEETYTACIPLGKKDDETKKYLTVESINDGSPIISNLDTVSKYGVKFAPPKLVTWEDVTRPENLKRKALDWLNNQGVMLNETISLSAIDLAYTSSDIESFECAKYIHIISKPHNLEKLYLLTKIDINLLNPVETRVELGLKRKVLTDKLSDTKDDINSLKEDITIVESVAKKDSQRAIEEIKTVSSTVIKTAEEVVLGIVSNYSKTTDLEALKEEIANRLSVTEQGFSFEFDRLKEQLTAVGNEINIQKKWIRLIDGEIHMGQANSPVSSVYTNNALEFRYNGTTVARFTNEFLEVRNVAVDNQLRFGDTWAIRPGEYVQGKGYNLNDVWIGG